METTSKKNAIFLAVLSVGVIMFIASPTHLSLANAQQQNKTLTQPQGVQSITANTTKTNIVLVHGAWADAASWDKVIPILQKAGHRVIAVELPEHSLADDVATAKRAINLVGGPVTLVGHSYGGMVITNAGSNNPNVKNLVYIAAFAPKEGQSIGDFVNPSKFPQGVLIKDEGGFLYFSTPNQFHDLFAQDLDPVQASILFAVQKPFNLSIFAEKSGPPAWKQHPTWYQVSDNDRSIPPDFERMFAKQMNATTISLPASHVSYISHPNEIAKLILDAAK
jgi:pimeloyl-ACP methyl ester carboxylesterase